MAMEDIQLKKAQFHDALDKYVACSQSLSNGKLTFNTICQNLLGGIEGKAAKEIADAVNKISKCYTNCIDDFETMRFIAIEGIKYFDQADNDIANGISCNGNGEVPSGNSSTMMGGKGEFPGNPSGIGPKYPGPINPHSNETIGPSLK